MIELRLKRFLAACGGMRQMVQRELCPAFRIPLGRRFSMLRRGFSSESVGLYDFKRYSRHDYLSEFAMYFRAVRINAEYNIVMNDKFIFSRLLSGVVDVPEVFAMIELGHVHSVHPKRLFRTVDDLLDLAREKALIFKPTRDGNRLGVTTLSHSEGTWHVNHRPVDRGAVLQMVRDMRCFYVSEFVQQAKYARDIFPYSANTIKVLTMIDPESGEPFAAGAFHRFGRNPTLPVDNVSGGGGIVAMIDLDTGILTKASAVKTLRPEYFDRHPVTGARIEGARVPGWSSVLEGCLNIARQFRPLRYVAWDLIVQDRGFTVLEGNANTDVDGFQSQWPLLTNPRVRAFYKHHGVIR